MLGIRKYFANALNFLFSAESDNYLTKSEVARLCKTTPSSLNDYVANRREGTEDRRRLIASALGWEYTALLALGQLIEEEYVPSEWELAPPLTSDNPAFHFFVRKGQRDQELADVLIVPPPLMSEEQTEVELHRMARRVTDPMSEYEFVEVYDTDTDKRFEWGTAMPQKAFAFREEWLRKFGGAKSVAAVYVPDDAIAPTLTKNDAVLVRRGDAQVREGDLYLIQIVQTWQMAIRRLAPRGTDFMVYADNNTLFPSYTVRTDEVHILGRVFWTGHEFA